MLVAEGSPAAALACIADPWRHPPGIRVVIDIGAGWYQCVDRVEQFGAELHVDRIQLLVELDHRARPDDGGAHCNRFSN